MIIKSLICQELANQNNLKISSCVILINFKTYQDSRNAGKNGNAFLKTIREVINY